MTGSLFYGFDLVPIILVGEARFIPLMHPHIELLLRGCRPRFLAVKQTDNRRSTQMDSHSFVWKKSLNLESTRTLHSLDLVDIRLNR